MADHIYRDRERAASAMARGARLREDERLQGRHAAAGQNQEPVSLSDVEASTLRWARDHGDETMADSVAGAFDIGRDDASRMLATLAGYGLFAAVPPIAWAPHETRWRLTFAGKLVADMSRGSES